MRITPLLVTLLLVNGSVMAQVCSRGAKKVSEETHFGGNERVVRTEMTAVRKVYGIVRDANGKAIPDSLVEIFEQPEWISKGDVSPPIDRKRIIACSTSGNGKFGVDGLAKGNYELRISNNSGFNVTYIYVVVDPNGKQKAKGMDVELTVGT